MHGQYGKLSEQDFNVSLSSNRGENVLNSIEILLNLKSSYFHWRRLKTEDSKQHKVSPTSTDPVHLYSLYSYLQNVNTVLLGSRLGATLSCLVAEKS